MYNDVFRLIDKMGVQVVDSRDVSGRLTDFILCLGGWLT